MANQIPDGMQDKLTYLDTELAGLEEGVKSSPPDNAFFLQQYNSLCNFMGELTKEAESQNLPPQVLEQFKAIQQDLAQAVKDNVFTPNAVQSIDEASKVIESLLPR